MRNRRLCLTPSLILVMFVFLSFPVWAGEGAEKLFEEGVDLFNRGQWEESLARFQSVLAENPSQEMAFEFWNQAGHEVFLEMLLKKGEYETVAKRFLELARLGRKEKEEDGARIQELVDRVVSGDPGDSAEALLILEADHGEYTVEYIYQELGGDNLESRVNVITGLVRMGEEVVLPLIQVLKSDNEMIRRNAAAVLGTIKDRRATAALKAMAENDESALCRKVAEDGLRNILGKGAQSLLSSAKLYLEMAKGYLKGDESIVKPNLPSRVIWKWREGRLTKVPVFKDLYTLKLAEQACHEALAHVDVTKEAAPLVALIYASQAARVDAFRQAMGEGTELPETLVDAALGLVYFERLVTLTGPEAMNRGLALALEGRHFSAAARLIQVMGRAWVSGKTLTEAVRCLDKGVRYQAALALAEQGDQSPVVVETLLSALMESAVRRVLVIDDESDTRNSLIQDLNESGYFAVGAATGEEGLALARAFPEKDLIVLRSRLKDITPDKILFGLSESAGEGAPVLLLTEEDRLEEVVAAWGAKVQGILTTPLNKAMFLPKVEEALGEADEAGIAQADALSLDAAKALAKMGPELLAPYRDSLTTTLGKPDEVKVYVLGMLRRVGDAGSLEKIQAVFNDTDASLECRVAAAYALGGIFSRLPEGPDKEILESLREALSSGETSLSAAAGAAIGKARGLPEGFWNEALLNHWID